MKNWNIPTVEELEVKLTASSGVSSTAEVNGGFIEGVWHDAQYDSNIYEKLTPDSECVVKVETAECMS